MIKYLANLAKAAVGRSFDVSNMDEERLREFLRVGGGNQSISGTSVNEQNTMKIGAAWRCIHLISGVVSSMPRDVIVRVDEKTRKPAIDHDLRYVLTVQPNRFQTPKQYLQMQTAWLLLRGNCYSQIVRGVGGKIIALIPLAPPKIAVKELPNGDLTYEYSAGEGKVVTFQRDDILHVTGLSLDGKTGLSVISYMRESLALALDGERAAATLMKNGTFVDAVIKHPSTMSKESHQRLKESWETRRQGVDNAGKTAILEEGASLEKMSMTAGDLQFLEQRDFQRYDIAMFFGVPPHMIGATEKTTSWGSGIEHMNIGFVQYTLNDWLVTWQEALKRDCLPRKQQETHDIRFYPQSLLKGDNKAQWDSFTKGRQWGIYSPNDVRGLLDMNPRTDPEGDEYAKPPNETNDDEKVVETEETEETNEK